MTDAKIVYDEERLMLDDMLRAEEEESLRVRMEVLSKIVQNGDGEWLPEDEAFEALRKFSLAEVRRAMDKVSEAARGQDSPK